MVGTSQQDAPAGPVLMVAPAGSRHANALAAALLRQRLCVIAVQGAPRSAAAFEAALRQLLQAPDLTGRRVGLYGCGPAVLAVLRVAAAAPALVAAVVACEGRPDRAGPALAAVQAPTLLLVGAGQAAPLAAGRAAMQRLACRKRLEVVPGGVDEPAALAALAELAAAWFASHLAEPPRA